MKDLFSVFFFVGLIFLPVTSNAQTTERILSYDSQIEIFQDSSMQVTETIQVISTGDQIKRGIYRDFPISYTGSNGERYLVSFDLLEVTRNGEEEPYRTERAGNGIRLYIGEEDVFIEPGQHTYAIRYMTDRQLGFFENHDELYWNVTGNGWVFDIDSVTATVKLPKDVPAVDISASLYTGSQGSRAQDGAFSISEGTVTFATNQPLSSYEGLTIVVEWPKGVVTPPTGAENFLAGLRANSDYLVGAIGLIAVIVFYSLAWRKRGRDPRKGTIIPLYESPRGFSPAFLRHVERMGSDDKAFAAAIIDLGVKGYVKISENKGGLFKSTAYTLEKTAGLEKGQLTDDEKLLLGQLFAEGNTLVLETKQASKISKMRTALADSLKKQAGNKYFTRNIPIIVIGVILSVLTIVGAMIAAALVRFSVDSWLTIAFWPVMVLGLVVINIVFGWLIKAYTVEGRKLVDEIEGFKWFLSVTEKERLAFHNPPEKTPELFEKMLPYALALGVEHQWAEQFSSVFARLKEQGIDYAPAWYYGHALANFNPGSFANNVGKSFSGAVASASTPPGSSSGGGGFSGGGGGGGGGGGW